MAALADQLHVDSAFVAGGAACLLGCPEQKLLSSSDIDIFVLNVKERDTVLENIKNKLMLLYPYAIIMQSNEAMLTVVRRYNDTKIQIILSPHQTMAAVLRYFDFDYVRAAFDGELLYRTFGAQRAWDTRSTGECYAMLVNPYRLQKALRKGFELPTRFLEILEDDKVSSTINTLYVGGGDVPRHIDENRFRMCHNMLSLSETPSAEWCKRTHSRYILPCEIKAKVEGAMFEARRGLFAKADDSVVLPLGKLRYHRCDEDKKELEFTLVPSFQDDMHRLALNLKRLLGSVHDLEDEITVADVIYVHLSLDDGTSVPLSLDGQSHTLDFYPAALENLMLTHLVCCEAKFKCIFETEEGSAVYVPVFNCLSALHLLRSRRGTVGSE